MKPVLRAHQAALISAILAAVAAPVSAQQVRFRTGDATLADLTAPAQKQQALARLLIDQPENAHVLVQFTGPVSLADRAALGAAGLELQAYVPDFAFFARLDAAALNPGAIAAVPSLRSIAPIQPEWKLHPMLLDKQVPDYAVIAGKDATDQIVAVEILFHRDAKLGLEAVNTLKRHGGVWIAELMSLPVVVAEVPLSNIAALAAEDSVQWIDIPLPKFSENSVVGLSTAAAGIASAATANNSNRPRVQADLLQAAPYNLDGSGVNVFVYDGGAVAATHQTFTTDGVAPSRVTVIDSSSAAVHSTHVAGTIGGNGTGEAGNIHKGMAPRVRFLSAGLSTAGCSSGSGQYFLYNCISDLETEYNAAINHATIRPDVANNSIGTNTAPNGFPCSLEGDYGLTDALLDNIVRGSLGRHFRIVWANGNERGSSNCNTNHNGVDYGGFYKTAPPATAKNHITVGALNSNDDSMTTFSSWGPTDDGRMKPDISAPGCQSNDDLGVTSSTTAPSSYSDLCGTSMASPTTCGIVALMIQDYRANFSTLPDPRNATLKVLLAHTAQDILNPGPDYKSGYGSIRGRDAVDFLRTARFFEGQLNQGDTFSSTIEAVAGQPLKVTLAWDDVPGTPNSTGAQVLVNDLDLRLIAPDNTVHYPWTLDPSNPNALAVRTQANHRDNIEQVLVDNPAPGNWRVEVVGFNVPSGPQTFSLANVSNGTAVGLSMVLGTTIPTLMAPGSTLDVDVNITPTNQTLVPGSPRVWSRVGAAAFASHPLTLVSGNTYRATLSAPPCGQPLNFYFSAEGSESGVINNPLPAPATFYSTASGIVTTAFHDDFQTDQGWTVTNTPIGGGTFDGAWQRGDPVTPATSGAPSVDGDGSGFCYVTDNSTSNGDVDFGFTTLTSPVIDASAQSATLSFYRWFHRTSTTAGGDVFRTEISTDGGGAWTTLDVLGATTGTIAGAWQLVTFPIPTPSAQFRVRFTVNDNATNSTAVEGGVDGVRILLTNCVDPTCPADWDNSGSVNPADVAAFVTAWVDSLNQGTLVADFDNSGAIDPADVALFVSAWLNAVTNGC